MELGKGPEDQAERNCVHKHGFRIFNELVPPEVLEREQKATSAPFYRSEASERKVWTKVLWPELVP